MSNTYKFFVLLLIANIYCTQITQNTYIFPRRLGKFLAAFETLPEHMNTLVIFKIVDFIDRINLNEVISDDEYTAYHNLCLKVCEMSRVNLKNNEFVLLIQSMFELISSVPCFNFLANIEYTFFVVFEAVDLPYINIICRKNLLTTLIEQYYKILNRDWSKADTRHFKVLQQLRDVVFILDPLICYSDKDKKENLYILSELSKSMISIKDHRLAFHVLKLCKLSYSSSLLELENIKSCMKPLLDICIVHLMTYDPTNKSQMNEFRLFIDEFVLYTDIFTIKELAEFKYLNSAMIKITELFYNYGMLEDYAGCFINYYAEHANISENLPEVVSNLKNVKFMHFLKHSINNVEEMLMNDVKRFYKNALSSIKNSYDLDVVSKSIEFLNLPKMLGIPRFKRFEKHLKEMWIDITSLVTRIKFKFKG